MIVSACFFPNKTLVATWKSSLGCEVGYCNGFMVGSFSDRYRIEIDVSPVFGHFPEDPILKKINTGFYFQSQLNLKKTIERLIFSPTAECYGVSAQYRFRCVLGELGRFREKTGSGKVPGESSGNRTGNRLGSRFQEPVPRFQGLDRFQGLEVPGTGSRLG